MEGMLTSPGLIDLIIGLTVLEAVVLIACARRTMGLVAVGLMLLPGICLLLAVREALAGAAWPWVPVALTAALIAHLTDVGSRWRR